MNIEVRMFMTFRRYLPQVSTNGTSIISLADGSTFADLLTTLGIPLAEPKLVIINGVSQGISERVNEHRLQHGDIVAIFPPAAGG